MLFSVSNTDIVGRKKLVSQQGVEHIRPSVTSPDALISCSIFDIKANQVN